MDTPVGVRTHNAAQMAVSERAAASPTPTPIPMATPVPTATPVPSAVTLADATGGCLDANGDRAKTGPPSTYIISVQAVAADGRLDLATDIAAAPPAVDPVSHQQLYGLSIDTNGDNSPEWRVLVQKVGPESEHNALGWIAGISSYADGMTHEGNAFPGTMDLKVVFPDPVKDPPGMIQRDDKVPDRKWADGSDWIAIAIP
jgi:hypothetical protein